MRRHAGFLLAAVGTLAIAIGLNTAIFSLVSGVLLRPLPYGQPDRLVVLYSQAERIGPNAVFYSDLQDWRSQSKSFDSMSAYGVASRNLTGDSDPERIAATWGERTSFGYSERHHCLAVPSRAETRWRWPSSALRCGSADSGAAAASSDETLCWTARRTGSSA